MLGKKISRKQISARITYVIGALVGVVAFGGILSFALSGSTDKEIPEDTGTLGAALNAIIGPNWQTGTLAKVAARLGGVEANYYVRMNSPNGLICNDMMDGGVSFSGLLTRIEQNGSIGCAKQLPSGSTILRPILATIRDLDTSCYGQVTVQNASGSTYSPGNSDPVDIYEGDTITTTPLCAMASLYFIDHSIVRLAPSTVLALRSAGTAGGSGSTDVTLSEGELWARVFKPITDDSYFNVSTEESSVGVRGTSLSVSRKKPGTIYETKIVAVDTGLASATGQVAQLSLSGSTGSIISLKLAQAVTVQKPLYSPSATITASSTSNSATIYQTFPFTRISTMEDLHDFDALKVGAGNLPTIAMTGGWLHGRDLYDTGSISSATKGISMGINKVALEIQRTETSPGGATTAEETSVCSTSGAAGAIAGALDLEKSDQIRCQSSTITAIINPDEGVYKADNTFYVKSSSTGSFDVGNVIANGGFVKDVGSSWTMSFSGNYTPRYDELNPGSLIPQHLFNIGNGSKYIRIYTLDDALNIAVPSNAPASATGTTLLSHLPNSGLNFSVYITRDFSGKLTIKIKDQFGLDIANASISGNNIAIQELFIGKSYTGLDVNWNGTIKNVKITK